MVLGIIMTHFNTETVPVPNSKRHKGVGKTELELHILTSALNRYE